MILQKPIVSLVEDLALATQLARCPAMPIVFVLETTLWQHALVLELARVINFFGVLRSILLGQNRPWRHKKARLTCVLVRKNLEIGILWGKKIGYCYWSM